MLHSGWGWVRLGVQGTKSPLLNAKVLCEQSARARLCQNQRFQSVFADYGAGCLGRRLCM